MTASLAFWIWAWIVLTSAVALAGLGWRAIRARDVARHRARLNAAIGLILLFVLSYGLKLAVLGREDLSHWSRTDLAILRTHESFIAVMLLCGGSARWLARRRGRLALATAGAPATGRRHRWLGRVALVAALGALVSGTLVLAGMFARNF